ncbi:MAG: hypothetical protein M3Q26_04210 [Acidobacteriota bacterium]|nr:hypothetical protein [Acidobacteriota bacterium]
MRKWLLRIGVVIFLAAAGLGVLIIRNEGDTTVVLLSYACGRTLLA